MTLPDFINMFLGFSLMRSSRGFGLHFEDIFHFFFKTGHSSNFPSGMPLLIWTILFMIIVVFYIYLIIKGFINDGIKIFIRLKIINIVLIPFWVINYFFIVYRGFNAAFGYLVFFNLAGFVAIIILIGINYIFQIFVSLPSILYINILYKNHSIRMIERVLHTILQFILVLGLFDNIYLIIKYKNHNGKANVA
jgi:hypothetical protein